MVEQSGCVCNAKTNETVLRTPTVQVAGLNDQSDMDLMSVETTSKYNDGVTYLVIVIDIFSRFLLVRPLKNNKKKK